MISVVEKKTDQGWVNWDEICVLKRRFIFVCFVINGSLNYTDDVDGGWEYALKGKQSGEGEFFLLVTRCTFRADESKDNDSYRNRERDGYGYGIGSG